MLGIDQRIGVIVPSNNSVIEPEFWSKVPRGVGIYCTRVLARGNLTHEAVRQMERNVGRAVEELAATLVDVIVYADMVTSFIMEPGWNEATTQRISQVTGIKSVSAWSALRAALLASGARRVCLGTPYPAEIHELARPFFVKSGFEVVSDSTLNIHGMSDVPRVSSERLRTVVRSLPTSGADAIVLLATDLPTYGQVETLERETGLRVLTSNQTLLWAALRIMGNTTVIPGLGGLFRVTAMSGEERPSL